MEHIEFNGIKHLLNEMFVNGKVEYCQYLPDVIFNHHYGVYQEFVNVYLDKNEEGVQNFIIDLLKENKVADEPDYVKWFAEYIREFLWYHNIWHKALFSVTWSTKVGNHYRTYYRSYQTREECNKFAMEKMHQDKVVDLMVQCDLYDRVYTHRFTTDYELREILG